MRITQLRFLQVRGTRLHDGAVNVAGFAVPMSVYPDRQADAMFRHQPRPVRPSQWKPSS